MFQLFMNDLREFEIYHSDVKTHYKDAVGEDLDL